MRCLLILLALFLVTVPRANGEETFRLPRTSVPVSYDLTLVTNIHNGTRRFDGVVKIEIQVTAVTETLTLHLRDLIIDGRIKVLDGGNVDIFASESTEPEKNFLHLQTTRQMVLGEKLNVEIVYHGNVQTSMAGFYLSSYKVGGITRFLGTTQLESSAARLVFPCYDEPEYKAIFNLKIVHDKGHNAISNMPETVVDNLDGTTTTTFNETPRMSSYLLAFIVSDFEYVTNNGTQSPGETVHRVYTRKEDVKKAEFALDSSVKFLKQLETYVGFKYELPKMYSAAIPDFAAGAMENWGLITYKEQYLIGDENSRPWDVLESLLTIAHELAHQFFGNAVTCKWWDQLWLNEGFATVFEYLLPEKVYPEMRFQDYYNVKVLQNAFLVDSEEVHPMTFDGDRVYRITYDKSGSVIRMFQHAVGEDAWVAGLLRYLQDNNHKPVTSDELLAAITTTIAEKGIRGANFSLTRAFRTWETQTGYPIVTVRTDSVKKVFSITQERYWAASETNRENIGRSWYIPLNFATAADRSFNDTTITDYFEDGAASKEVNFSSGFDGSDWFVFNKQQIGLYRVNYRQSNWNALIEVLNSENFNQIHVLNRAQLVDDALNLAADGYLEFETAFEVLNYLRRETDYIPWHSAVVSLDRIDHLLKSDPTTQNIFRGFVSDLVGKMFNVHGVREKSGDALMTKFVREIAIEWACRSGNRDCLAQTSSLLKQAIDSGSKIPASLEVTYMCNGQQGLNQFDLYVTWWNRMQASSDQAERLRLIDGILCLTDSEVLVEFLKTTLTDEDGSLYRQHEHTRIFNGVFSKNSAGIFATIEFLAQNYIDASAVHGWSSINSLLASMSKKVVTDEEDEKLSELLNLLGSNVTDSTKTQISKNIRFNQNWSGSNKFVDIYNFLYSKAMSKNKEIERQLRLPKFAVPSTYRISIDVRKLHLGEVAFTGDVEIDIETFAFTDYIQLHSKNQAIKSLSVRNRVGSSEIAVSEYVLNTFSETLTIYLADSLPTGTNATISVSYSAELGTTDEGFWQSSYTQNGSTRYLAATQFESAFARHAFPNFDEPAFKAVFELKITHDPSYTAIANTPGERRENVAEGTVTTTFKPSQVMSSYLVAFVVSDFGSISNEDSKKSGEVLHRVWVRSDSVEKARWALNNSIKSLDALEEYTGFSYEFAELQSVGVPRMSGAMENWGLVIYSESSMITYEIEDDIPHRSKYGTASVVAHENAHQFFGDSVTCEWWDYLWLNEGFATMFSTQIMDTLYPDWNAKYFFNVNTMQSAMRSDSISTTKSMTPKVSFETVEEIEASFSYVAYGKAGSVLRMFQNALGHEIVKASLKKYLEDNDHTAVTSDDLIAAFTEIMTQKGFTAFNFETAFRSWELQAGYPLIHVTLNNGQFQVAQERFFTNKTINSGDTSSWYIPLNFGTAGSNFEDTSITNYFVAGESSVTIAAPADATQWFVFNKQQLGYYRVNYDAANWNALINTLNSEHFNKIHVLNRAQLLDDCLAFATGRYLNFDTFFGILTYLERETEYIPFAVADRFFSQLFTTFGTFNNDLNSFIEILSKELYNQFKIPNDRRIPSESVYNRYGREWAVKTACNSGNKQCLDEMLVQTQSYLKGEAKIPNGLHGVVLCGGIKTSNNRSDWQQLYWQMHETLDVSIKAQFISSLGCTSDKIALRSYLESSIGNGASFSYSRDERRNVLNAVLNSVNGLDVAIAFLEDYELDIMNVYRYDLETLITVLAKSVKTTQQRSVFINYLATMTHLETAASTRIRKIVDDSLMAQSQQMNVGHMEKIRAFLAKRELTTTTPRSTTISSSVTSTTVQTTTAGASTNHFKVLSLSIALFISLNFIV